MPAPFPNPAPSPVYLDMVLQAVSMLAPAERLVAQAAFPASTTAPFGSTEISAPCHWNVSMPPESS